jgi:hypothetical protein
MVVDFVIVGQGIAGSLLSWFLQQAGKTVLVIDDGSDTAASKVAAGIINPVTGRRYSTTWKADELLPFAWKTYTDLGDHFQTQYCFQKDIIEFFPGPEARNVFIEKIKSGNGYMDAFPDQNRFNETLHYDFGCGSIAPSYISSTGLLLADIRRHLIHTNALRTEAFIYADLLPEDGGIRYQDIQAQKILFCEGSPGVDNPWFRLLPYAINKGEALIIECPGLADTYIYKKGFLLAPLPVQQHFWAGSNYEWDELDCNPTEAFRKRTMSLLDGFLKLPYKLLQHKAALRPATVERRPFVGIHPHHPQIGILNGFGTKGTSLAPYFAQQLANHLLYDSPITPEADVKRFQKLLARES